MTKYYCHECKKVYTDVLKVFTQCPHETYEIIKDRQEPEHNPVSLRLCLQRVKR